MSSSYKHSHPFSNGSKINKRYLFDTKKTSKDDEESLMMQKTKIKDKYFFFFIKLHDFHEVSNFIAYIMCAAVDNI